MPVDDQFAQHVSSLIEQSSEWNEAAIELRRANTDGDDYLEALEHAFDYNLVVHDEDQRDQHGPLAPLMEGDGRSYPAPVAIAPDEHLRMWAEVHDGVDHPLIRSRLGDLLWVRRHGTKAHLYARSAIEAYRSLARSEKLHGVVRADCLHRALQLAKELNDATLIDEVITQAVEALRLGLEAGGPLPGEIINLFDVLMASRKPPEEIDPLLERAIERLGNDPWLLRELVEIQVSRTNDPDERRAAFEQLVDKWRQVAVKAEGVTRVVFFNTALEIAQAGGLADLSDEIRVDLQEITNEELDLKKISASVELDTEKVEAWLESFLKGDDWRAWLTRFGAHVPISARDSAVLTAIQERMRQHPLTYLFTTVAMGPGDVPLKFLQTDEEKLMHEVASDEVMKISFWANFAVDVLDRVNDRASPSMDELTDFFTTDLIPEGVAERFAASFDHYRNGRFDESALVALPRIELVIRRAATQLRLPTYREPTGDKTGRFVGLGDLLRLLTGRFGSESQRQYMLTLLADPLGVNLRNLVLHGLSPKAAKSEAGLCLHVATALASMQKTNRGTDSDD